MDLKAHKDETTGRWTLEGVEPSEKTFERMCQMLRDGENFKFARYGDGELACMSGKIGRNCDKHEYFPDLGQALNDAFYSDPKYMVGIQPLSVQGGLYQKALEFAPGPKNIYDADVLHSTSIDGKLIEIFEACIGRPTICVGANHLLELCDIHIEIPVSNCWLLHNETCDQLYATLKHLDPLGISTTKPVVFLCASMMSEVMIHRFQHLNCTVIDAGSVFDPYFNKQSRSYHHKKQTWTLS